METKLHSFVDYCFPPVVRDGHVIHLKIRCHKFARIKSRDIKTLKIPDGAYGFRFFDVQTAIANGIVMQSRRFNISKMHFCDGQIMSVKKALPVITNHRLLERIRTENWNRLVLCNDGEFRQFRHGDCVVMTGKK